MKNKKIFVITVGPSHAASTKFRIKQYESFFLENGFQLKCVCQHDLKTEHLEMIAQADLVINQKCLLDVGLAKKIFALNPRVIFDFDDSIYTRPGKPYSWITRLRMNRRFKTWMSKSYYVVAANNYLSDYAKQYTSRIDILPMALDLNLWKPKRHSSEKKIIIGWAGVPGNHHHIEKIEPILSSLLNKYPQVNLSIYSGKRPKLQCRYDYTPFTDGTEHSFIQGLDIGLLPLTDEEYSRGKSPLKAIQYLSCGVPVVGNVFGATFEIMNTNNSLVVKTNKDWAEALEKLILDKSLRNKLGQAGRAHIEKHHNFQNTKYQFLKLLNLLYSEK